MYAIISMCISWLPFQYLRDDDHKMEDKHVQDDVKDEVTLLESKTKQVFQQRILIHNQ